MYFSAGVEDEEESTSALGPKPSEKAIPRIPSIRPSTPDRVTPSEEDLEEHLGPDDSASQTGLDRFQFYDYNNNNYNNGPTSVMTCLFHNNDNNSTLI